MFRALLIILSTGFFLSQQACKAPEAYEAIPILLSAPEAAKVASHPNVLFLEVSPLSAYKGGHIAGAGHMWRPEFTDTTYAYGGMSAQPSQLAEALRKRGVSQHTHLVLYDEKGSCEAARLRWVLRQYGFDQVCILDGGKQAWTAAGYSLSSEVAQPDYGNLSLQESSMGGPMKYEEVLAARENPDVILLDTRSAAEYWGEMKKKGAAQAGRIPGALHLDWSEAVNFGTDFRFKSPEALKMLYIKNGIIPEKHIICYCQSGVRSAHTTFVLKEILGYPRVSNYDGSWIEWSHREDAPIEAGRTTSQLDTTY